MLTRGQPSETDTAPAVPSVFKYFVGASAFLIAGCSAFFSVWGLGLLFVGSATAVMVMAASLEVGKLVGASFLYRYWHSIGLALKIYLSIAILALIGITSLGNYGYLARAYERTHTQIVMHENQIASIEKEIADTQRQIDGSRGQLTKATDVGREDTSKLQQRVSEANAALSLSLVRLDERRKAAQDRRATETTTGAAALSQSLARTQERRKAAQESREKDTVSTLTQSLVRLQERRKTAQERRATETTGSTTGIAQSLGQLQERRKIAQDRRDRDIQVPVQRTVERAEVLKKAIASEETAAAESNERIAVLDRAVDAYTKEGGAGFFKIDSIKKGQKLRQEQAPGREAIKVELAEHRTRMEELRGQHAKQSEAADQEIATVRAQFSQEMGRLDAEEKALRQTTSESSTLAEQKFTQETARFDAEEQTLRKAHADGLTSAEQLFAQEMSRLEAEDLALRKAHTDSSALADQHLSQEMSRIDAEDLALRKSHAESNTQLAQQLAMLQTQGQTTQAAGGTQVESLYQRIRTLNEEAHQLRNQIAASDIGSYRFVARAFEAPADNIVKWLMLALVLVFDPFAVCLMIGFNVALLRDGPAPRAARTAPAQSETIAGGAAAPAGNSRWTMLGFSALGAAVVIIVVVAAQQWRKLTGRETQKTSHTRFIPADSFAVATFRPEELKSQAQAATNSFAGAVTKMISSSLNGLMTSGLDAQAPIYAFAKFPAKRGTENGTRPVMLCGVVARVTDPGATEAALGRLAAQVASSLRTTSASTPSLIRNHAMIRSGTGRYMDPEGGFFSFGLTEQAAIVIIELEGDSQSPCVENEMKLWLAKPDATASVSAQPRAQLPARALNQDATIAIWVDAGKFFTGLPKNPAAVTRYQQLQQRLGFDLVLQMKSAGENQLKIVADYAYQFDRFKDREQPAEVTALAAAGAPDEAGLAGRLMDRCVDTLDYTSLIERLRSVLGGPQQTGAQQLQIEKSFTNARDAQFVMLAPYDASSSSSVMTAVQNLFP